MNQWDLVPQETIFFFAVRGYINHSTRPGNNIQMLQHAAAPLLLVTQIAAKKVSLEKWYKLNHEPVSLMLGGHYPILSTYTFLWSGLPHVHRLADNR